MMNLNYIRLAALAGALVLSFSTQALAPANTQLLNTATLTYAGNATGVSANVIVTIDMVEAGVIYVLTPVDTTIAENQGYSDTFKVRAQNNGFDTYTISSTGVVPTNLSPAGTFSYTHPDEPAAFGLGASALTADVISSTTITIPSDGSAEDDEVNGLTINDTVYINGVEYTIVDVSDPVGGGDATLTLNDPITASMGDGVFESKTFTIDSTDVGSIDVDGVAASLIVTTRVSNGTDNADHPLTLDIASVKVTKYVRCISDCNETGGTGAVPYDVSDNSTDPADPKYYSAGVTAEPGAVLEYLIIMENTSASDITDALLVDVLADFTSYKPGTTFLNSGSLDDEVSVPLFVLDSGADGGGLSVGDATSFAANAEDDGVIPGGSKAYVVYQVDVD